MSADTYEILQFVKEQFVEVTGKTDLSDEEVIEILMSSYVKSLSE